MPLRPVQAGEFGSTGWRCLDSPLAGIGDERSQPGIGADTPPHAWPGAGVNSSGAGSCDTKPFSPTAPGFMNSRSPSTVHDLPRIGWQGAIT